MLLQIWDTVTSKLKKISIDNPMPVTHSARSAVAVVPSNTVDLAAGVTKYVYVAVAGDLKADMADGTTITFTGLTAGVLHPLSVKRIYATGTTATSIIAVR